ncbi:MULTISPECIES: protein-arginine deiminase family protein [unclassified Microcoleus]|uniref:protein-arginine deiminase family protein n=1 Tax=unclassified Microcoleus TaxID=2642155 RepID=UPI001DE683E8|nr:MULTISPECIES: protein-arginine deiminase family protein [unclassified Microcoleus]MCC3506820.1 protein-arginine deiminase [Microcoleus sp. PH2017_19_SFW_U_A]TAG93361.1 MAG: protein-arginine deiminase [Oscillatoriales cyanobacterium]MCC3496392.1 protein-arginine deiminase [Microcoleus sp. PH2017_15_JOR_U_A]MCC3521823.1 protein-arginine deiminase [Microcoleus sp. PH2017_20_SFW_D_A]MCC3552791.1 protein-arginine deiminase [Microcoleus sp. PH2017_35_SFW_U_B]
MRWVRYVAIAIVNAFGVVIGIIWVAIPTTVAQPTLNYKLALSARQPDGDTPQSLPELYKLRDRLKVRLDKLAQTPDSSLFSPEYWQPESPRNQSQTLTQQLQNLQNQIEIEKQAKNNWDEAARLASQAVVIGRTSKADPATWEQSQRFWQLAINNLRLIPHGSFLAERAIDKTIEYQGNLTLATYEWQVARSAQKIRAEEEQVREIARKEQEKIEFARREIERQEQEKKELARREIERQEFARQELVRKEQEKQELARQAKEREELALKELTRQELEKQELALKEQQRQQLELNQQPTPQPTPESTATPTPESTATATPTPVTPATSATNFFFAGDTNRDGKINQVDEAGKEQWSLSSGALIVYNDRNNDRRSKIPTWQETKVSVPRRAAMLSQVNLILSENFKDSQLFITADSIGSSHISVFQKTADGWLPVDISGTKPLIFNTNIVLGVEAKQFADRNWNGQVNLKATAENNGQQIATTTIQMGVSPWMIAPNTAPVTELQVSDRGSANSEFISQLKQAVEPTGAQVKIIQGDNAWMQDSQKNGYVQVPEKSDMRQVNVAIKSPSNSALDKPAKSTQERDLRVFKIGKPRSLDPVNQWSDGYGNLQVTPPIPGHPMGRVYYGNSGNAGFNPEVLDFIQAQRIQGPAVDIDTSWLLTRQVDEIINFIPSQTPGKYIMAIASPEAGVRLLEELAGKGYGDVTINRGLSTETTVRAALNNPALIQHNLNLQKQKIYPILEKLKREFSLADDQIVQVPAMFGYSGYAWWPNMVNSVPVNGKLLVSNPRGPIIDGLDYTQERLRQLLLPAGVSMSFLDDRYYQELKGNVQSATNTVRKPEPRPFWQSLPNN